MEQKNLSCVALPLRNCHFAPKSVTLAAKNVTRCGAKRNLRRDCTAQSANFLQGEIQQHGQGGSITIHM
ncbi:hypothetical protein [Aurantiacibacter rhizosphaerae]|uniref:Uncharacterized protein n=1 Tax=Aurantiacibacter rhizosphaerae TaxID=2691582 RepID=A0A844XI92_9SPHN|nr:hypothetical protein [Aurantiacibacter rhizosphaerae]MWV29433.1 hypothetical protein [Aurantiacibacter rhizosphaerae]